MDKDKEIRLTRLLLIEPSKRTKKQKAELGLLIKGKKAEIDKRLGSYHKALGCLCCISHSMLVRTVGLS